MKILTVVALIGLTLAFMQQDNDRATGTEAVIRDLELELGSALMQGDIATVDRILANDYVEITARGLLKRKPDVMTLVRARNAAPRVPSIGPEVTVAETRIRIYGDVVLWSGLRTIRYQYMEYESSPSPGQLPAEVTAEQERFTKVYAKSKDRWHLVAAQTTAVVKH